MNMSEEEDCDDLPSITVNSSAHNSSTFAMPTAEEVAEHRARELECARRLEMLHQRAIADQRVAPLRHSDSSGSSGSEGELALAAAVTALSVRADRPQAAHAARPAAALWAALSPPLPPGAPAPVGLRRAADAPAAALAAGGAPWPDDELLGAGALLSVAVLAREGRGRRAAARTLQALLDDRATVAQESQLTTVLLAALPDARTRLQLADALRSGGQAGADRAAFALAAHAVLELLRAPASPHDASLQRVAHAAAAWRASDPDTRYVCVQLCGRLLAATSATSATPEERDRLLAHLAPPPAAASDAHRPDRLKALVGASKLKLLFCTKNAASRQPRAQRETST